MSTFNGLPSALHVTCSVTFLISGAPCIWLKALNTLKPSYNSPITGDFREPEHDSDEIRGQVGGPAASTCLLSCRRDARFPAHQRPAASWMEMRYQLVMRSIRDL